MGIGGGVGVVLEGVRASVAALDGLTFEDQNLEDAAMTAVGSGVDVLQRRYEIRLERLEVAARLEAQLAAVKAQDAAESVGFQEALTPPDASDSDRTYVQMSVVEEIAGVLAISSAAAGALVEQSRRVCSLPLAFETLAAGAMSWQHARIIADETEGLDGSGAAALVAHFFDPAAPHPARGAAPGDLVPSRFRAKVRSWRERHHPESIQKRHAKGAADRRMEYTPDTDGMAWLSLYLPGDTACAIWNRTTATARGLQGPNEPRTLTQLRPDIAASLLLGAGKPAEVGKVPTPRADVLVLVPVLSMLGTTDEPAELDGFGPIPASMARRLVADGADSFYRVLVDPRDGAPLEIGRKNYRLTGPIKHWIRLRDAKCTFPGCTNKTPDNDTDHLQAWEHGGTTDVSNLAQLCPKHHRLKHHSQWTPGPANKNEPPGWTSPTGRHYNPEQQDAEPTHWPQWLLALFSDASERDTSTGATKQADEYAATPCPCLEASLENLPQWEPDDEASIDPSDLSPDDPLWAELLSTSFALFPDAIGARP
ncbi:HNH endonuclease [Pseudarthrobacter sp. NPDC058119]|uniref:HNH endonuclease signature motif containing protein n=1 Tax=Pseudarthrobacter sp. NPDC058119 TaxID=3346348 RepID=UPI0036D975F5